MTAASRLLAAIRASGCFPYLDRFQQVWFPQPIPDEVRGLVPGLGNELRELLQLETISSPVEGYSSPDRATSQKGIDAHNLDAGSESGLRAGENLEGGVL
jgi:hypothetical protein